MRRFMGLSLALAALVGTALAAEAAEAVNVELASVGLDEAVVLIAAEEGASVVVRYGTAAPDRTAALNSVKGRWHWAALEGLAQGTEYVYEVEVDGRLVPTTEWHPGRFATLEEPGEFRFAFATITDTHVGEQVCGLIGGTDIAGYSWPDPANPYWKFTNEAAVAAINAHPDVAFVIHKGDVSSEAEPAHFEEAKRIFGALRAPVHYVRGNHDRASDEADAFADAFGLDPTWRAFDYGRHRFLLLDSNTPGGGWPSIVGEQRTWLAGELADGKAAERPLWLFLHHAASEKADFIYTLLGEPQQDLLAMIADAAPFVVGAFSGHSHRNARVDSDIAPGVAFVETAATKEYAGAWTETRVYSEGWLNITHPLDCPECREWFALTIGMYNGRAQKLKMGRLEDRCFVARFPEALREAEEAPGDEDRAASADSEKPDGACRQTAAATEWAAALLLGWAARRRRGARL